jgi:DNA-binding response OmpR family regulator
MTPVTNVKILIGVCDEVVAETIKTLFEQAGFRNIELRPDDDRELFAKHRAGDYGLFVVQPSSKPPGMMDGLQLLSEVRKRDRHARFLVVSCSDEAFLQRSIRRSGLDLGNYTYLGMAFGLNELLPAIDHALGNHNGSAA